MDCRPARCRQSVEPLFCVGPVKSGRSPLKPVKFPFQRAVRVELQRALLRRVPQVSFAAIAFLFTAVSAQAQTDMPVVKLQLHWTHQAQFAGYYVAKDLGFY